MGLINKLFRLRAYKSSVRIELIAGTCLVTAVSTIVVGIFTNTPVAMAPGMAFGFIFHCLFLVIVWE